MQKNEEENKNHQSSASAIKKSKSYPPVPTCQNVYFCLENTTKTTGQQIVSSDYCLTARRICQKIRKYIRDEARTSF